MLIGRRIQEEFVTLVQEQFLQLHSQVNGALGYLEVQSVREQGVKLDAQQAAFGHQGTVLFHHGKEVLRSLSGRENHGLAAEGAYLGTADGEDVAEPGQILDGDVAGGAHKAVTQTGTVHKQRQGVFLTHCVNIREFLLGIERTVLRREGNIHHTGEDHMVVGTVGVITFQIVLKILGRHFAFPLRQRQYLVAGVFHSAGFVHGNVAGLGRHNALVVPEHGGNDGGIGLGTAGEEEHLRLGAAHRFADAGFGRSRETICPIPGLLYEIGSDKALQDSRMGAFVVIAGKRDHKFAMSSTGQWSEPKISLWMSVETMLSLRDSDTTK